MEIFLNPSRVSVDLLFPVLHDDVDSTYRERTGHTINESLAVSANTNAAKQKAALDGSGSAV
jgi:hypothetical protein